MKENQLTESQRRQKELEPIEEENWKTYGELEAKIKELQNNLERVKKENNDLYNRIAKLKEAELAAHTLQKTRESGL